MSVTGRLMGIDHGERRIGVALSDPLRIIASPHSIITRTTDADAIATLVGLIRAEQVSKVVIGLPTGTDGGVGQQAAIVIHWARKLAEAIEQPIVFWDESYSSADALEMQRASGKRKKRGDRTPLDDVAAAAILQEYLLAGEGNDEPGQPLDTYSEIP